MERATDPLKILASVSGRPRHGFFAQDLTRVASALRAVDAQPKPPPPSQFFSVGGRGGVWGEGLVLLLRGAKGSLIIVSLLSSLIAT